MWKKKSQHIINFTTTGFLDRIICHRIIFLQYLIFGKVHKLFNTSIKVKDANTFLLIKELLSRKDEYSNSLFKINLIKSIKDELFFGGIYSNQLLSLDCYLEMYPEEMDFILDI